MKKHVLMLFLAAGAAGALYSCEPASDPSQIPVPPDAPEEKPEEKPDKPDQPDTPDTPDDKPTAPEETTIYYDNLDKVKSDANNHYFNEWTACRNMEGTGTDGINYDGFYTSVRSTFPSSGYPGASGLNGVYYSKADAWTAVKGIRLPAETRTFKLTVGLYAGQQTSLPENGFRIILSDEHGEKDIDLEYGTQKYGQYWHLATSVFNITSESTTRLNIKIVALAGGAQGRTDDLKLVSTTESASLSFDFGHTGTPVPSAVDYIERPKTLKENKDYRYIDHRGTTYRTKQDVRNYEACYDIRRHNPIWVAYACHEIWWEGGYTRPVKDPWRPDPQLAENEQSVIYAADWNGWPWSYNGGKPSDLYQYWSPLPTGKTVIKGHLMRSAERGCGDRDNPIEMNVQTFYPTNIAPECYQNTTSGNSHWEMIENILPDKWRCHDTVYVVAGCVYEDESRQLNDASNWGTLSEKSKPCTVPTARYKIILRTKSGNTGKAVHECRAEELMAIGFWFPQNFTGEVLSELPPLSGYICTVAEIEKRLGGEFSFFPLAPEGVKESFDISDWPGLTEIAR